jgi:hypothetical protein
MSIAASRGSIDRSPEGFGDDASVAAGASVGAVAVTMGSRVVVRPGTKCYSNKPSMAMSQLCNETLQAEIAAVQ